MSRDIRSYFANLSSSKPGENKPLSKKRVFSSDEEESKDKTVNKKSKINKKGKTTIISSDSDDEVTVAKNNLHEKSKKLEKIVSPQDIFGKGPIKRTPAPKIQKKGPLKEETKSSLSKKEAEFHNDDAFDDTLTQLDTSMIEEEYLASVDNKNNINNVKDKKVLTHVDEQHNKRKGTGDTEKHEKMQKCSPDQKQSSQKYKQETKKLNASKVQKKRSIVEVEKESPKKSSNKMEHEKDLFEEIIEKKKQNATLYQQYLHRGGARHPGSKEIPQGKDYCLAGLSFVITGVLDSLEREEAEEIITKYGGRILHQVSKKTNYVIIGDQPGPSKVEKANKYNIPKINEDDLLELIRTRPAGESNDVILPHQRSKIHDKEKESEVELISLTKQSPQKKESINSKSMDNEIDKESAKLKFSPEKLESKNSENVNDNSTEVKQSNIAQSKTTLCEALVEKYRPRKLKQLIGQQGEKSCARKLYNWLSNWQKNQSGNVKHTKPSPWAKDNDGAFFKAALLSGPPGVGKTTTVQVVCSELGFDLIEFNASDTRSKKLLKDEVSALLSNTTMKGYFTGGNKEKPSCKHALLMDEVDGMAGNEDRGGLQELITLIKSTSIPIICICNDRNNPKMRTLANYTFDLRFSKPRMEQIKGAMMSICYKEGINISSDELTRLIESTDHDVRQTINHLSMFSSNTTNNANTTIDSTKKTMNKDLRFGPWDVVRKVFSSEEHKQMSIHDKSNLFFHDYSLAPLFVQENYLSVVPDAPKVEHLERIALTAESLAFGDIIENKIRRDGAWSLLPVQAYFSSVMPGFYMSGRITGQINFPSWFGRNSKTAKFNRLSQELTVHTRLVTGASKEAITLDYLKPLRDKICRPLVTKGLEGVDEAVENMNNYHLMREDLDSLIEISLWPGQQDPMQTVPSKVKTAFTKLYNKKAVTYVNYNSGTSKRKAEQMSQDEGYIEGEDVENDEALSEEADSIDNDKMIKAKKPSSVTASTSKADHKPSKQGRGRGRGRGK